MLKTVIAFFLEKIGSFSITKILGMIFTKETKAGLMDFAKNTGLPKTVEDSVYKLFFNLGKGAKSQVCKIFGKDFGNTGLLIMDAITDIANKAFDDGLKN